jgi:hypothetical protein
MLCKVLMYNYIKTPHRISKYIAKDSITMSLLELRSENINCIGLNRVVCSRGYFVDGEDSSKTTFIVYILLCVVYEKI